MKGFTFVEILISITLMVVVLAFVLPGSLRFLGLQNLDDTAQSLIVSLRQAQTQAVYQKNDSSFGVKFFEDSYVLFQGASYTTRVQNQDIATTLPTNVVLSGIDEIVFAKQTGIPDETGVVLLQANTESKSVSINEQGLIELL